MAVEIATIKTVVLRMEARLFGDDGESGVLARHADRLTNLERAESKARGAFWTLSSIFTLGASAFLRHLFSGQGGK